MATVSMTSIPPDFFDEERDKVFQMEIIQDSLVERIDKLIKKSSEVDARLDIIEEEMEEQTKISINGKTIHLSQLRTVSNGPVSTSPVLNLISLKPNQPLIGPVSNRPVPKKTGLKPDQSQAYQSEVHRSQAK